MSQSPPVQRSPTNLQMNPVRLFMRMSHAMVVESAQSLGFRYKCIVCHNFDFCERCESEGKHAHAFIKIRHPSQVPRVLITSEEGVNPGVNINGQNLNFKDLLNNPGPAIEIANQFIPGLNLTEEKVNKFCDKFKSHINEKRDRHCGFGRFSDFFNGFFPGFGSQTQEEK